MALRKKAAEEKKKTSASPRDYAVLIEPVITEKSSLVQGSKGATAIVFRVDARSTKTEIKAAVKRVFNVEVGSVNTVNYQGKFKSRGVTHGQQSGFKKAYVTLKPGHTIDLIEGL